MEGRSKLIVGRRQEVRKKVVERTRKWKKNRERRKEREKVGRGR